MVPPPPPSCTWWARVQWYLPEFILGLARADPGIHLGMYIVWKTWPSHYPQPPPGFIWDLSFKNYTAQLAVRVVLIDCSQGVCRRLGAVSTVQVSMESPESLYYRWKPSVMRNLGLPQFTHKSSKLNGWCATLLWRDFWKESALFCPISLTNVPSTFQWWWI